LDDLDRSRRFCAASSAETSGHKIGLSALFTVQFILILRSFAIASFAHLMGRVMALQELAAVNGSKQQPCAASSFSLAAMARALR